MTKLTEEKIQGILRAQYMSSPKYMMENLYVFRWESDFLAKTVSGYWYEVEIKISFSDFKNDAKHKREKFEILKDGKYCHRGQIFTENKRPNYFSYCVTEDIVEKVKPLIPDYAGLWYIDEKHNRLVKVRAPKQLHKDKIKDENLKLVEKFYYNYRTWKNASANWQERIEEANHQIKMLKAEYKAATGYDINENF